MMTVGAMVLLGYTILATNRSSLTHGVILRQTEIGIYMISLAISRIEAASGKSFDENSIKNRVIWTSGLTSKSDFGPDHQGTDTAEVHNTDIDFDDFDDFDDLIDTTFVQGVDNLVVESHVRYVNPSFPDTVLSAGTKTFHKRLDVSVYRISPTDATYFSERDTVRLSFIFSYWSFR